MGTKNHMSYLEARYFMSYIEAHEGRRLQVYKDIYGNRTVGIGHLITDKERIEYYITDAECERLFDYDLEQKLDLVKKTFKGCFEYYPLYVQAAMLDGFFRGDLSGSPKTIKLMLDGKWLEASKEYLNNKEYKLSKQNKSGVWKRMLENSCHFANYAEELEGSKS